MLKLIPLLTLIFMSPVPPGTVFAKVKEVRLPAKLIDHCLGSPYVNPMTTLVTVKVLDVPDGDDQQPFAITIKSRAHEDAVACLWDGVKGWAP